MDREESKKAFLKAKTQEDFLNLWSKFYENKIQIPTYFGNFIGDEDSDNPYADIELGLKFREITLRGVMAIDSQVNVPGYQKGYVIGYMPKKLCDYVIEKLNKYNCIVAFNCPIREGLGVENLYVTYDQTNEQIEKSAKRGKMYGPGFTNIGRSDESSLDFIREWMSPEVKKKINNERWDYFVITCPCFDASKNYHVDCLLHVLRNI